MAFAFMPKVSNCCGSVGLKIACIIIAVCTVLFGCGLGYNNISFNCWVVMAVRNQSIYKIADNLIYLLYVCAGCYLIGAISLLIGVLANIKILVTIYMYIIIIACALSIVSVLMLLIGIFLNLPYCTMIDLLATILKVLGPLAMLYFCIVVNSYEEEMG